MTDNFAADAARILIETRSVLINTKEPFLYTSGKRGPVYVDCRRLISFPAARAKLMDMGAELIRTQCPGTEYVAGGETAGIPYAAFLAERLNLPMLYVRKKAKGFGRNAQIEGWMEEDGRRVVITEDVQNQGVSVKIFVDALRAASAVVEHIFVIFEYGHESSRAAMKEMGVTLHSLTGWPAVLDVAEREGYFDAAAIAEVKSYLRAPDEWAA
jgi:orotate phosphoribosyltransferase